MPAVFQLNKSVSSAPGINSGRNDIKILISDRKSVNAIVLKISRGPIGVVKTTQARIVERILKQMILAINA